MVDGKHKINTLCHLYATGNFDKSLFLCFILRIVYTYMYVYDVVWRGDSDEIMFMRCKK